MLVPVARSAFEKESGMTRLLAGALMAAVIVLAAGGWAPQSWAQAKIPRVGMLVLSQANLQQLGYPPLPFTRGLAERGWVPGKNVVLEYRCT
jgi:hypothetical protein